MSDTPDTALERTVTVLWDLDRKGTRGPSPALSRRDIVDAAVAVADDEGFAALSMRSVAAKLGAGTMSLYRHVPGRAELIALMIDQVSGEMEPPTPDGDWRRELEKVAWEEWNMMHRHPWLAEAPYSRTAPGPHSMRHYDAGLAVGLAAGLPPQDAAHVMSALYTLVSGAAQASLAEAAAIEESGLDIGQWYQRQIAMLADEFTPERFPAINQVHVEKPDAQETASAGAFAESFRYGLSLLLDGVAARVTQGSTFRGRVDP